MDSLMSNKAEILLTAYPPFCLDNGSFFMNPPMIDKIQSLIESLFISGTVFLSIMNLQMMSKDWFPFESFHIVITKDYLVINIIWSK